MALAAVLAAGTAHAEPISFHAALELADKTSPDVAAKAKGLEAARSAAVPAGRLPDPRLSVGVQNFPISGPPAGTFSGDEMTMATVGVSQDVPNAAKRRARVDRAHAEVDSAAQEVEIESLDVRTATASAWLDLYYAQRRLALLDALEKDVRILKDTLPARLAAGQAKAADVTAPDEALVELADRRTDLTAATLKARAELRRWVGEATDEGLAGDPPAMQVDPNGLRAALEMHPRLHHFLHMEAMADADVAEARAAKHPDIGWQATYEHRDPRFGDMVSVVATIDLPLFPSHRQDPMIASKAAEASRVRIEQQAVARALATDLEETLANYASAADRLERARATSLPLADRRVDLAQSAYRGGVGSLTDVIDARRARTETALRIIDLEAETARLAARLAIYFGGEQP
jgi:outer membrane protein TolC